MDYGGGLEKSHLSQAQMNNMDENGNKGIDRFKLNLEIAYKGRIGRLRERFCIEQIKYINACHRQSALEQIEYAKARGETISCQKGCSFCCHFYVEASLQECEAIVYYLYHNEKALHTFLGKYPQWRAKLRESGDLFRRCEQIFCEMLAFGSNKPREQAFEEAIRHYRQQNISCPFLDNDLCVIYEVRPYTCAGLFVTTPPELCNPLNPNEPKFNLTITDEVMFDLSFYYKRLNQPNLMFMPVAVYEILEKSLSYLSRFSGLESLEYEVLNDPEVKEIIKSYNVSR